MAADKYIALIAGKLKEVFGSTTGTANAIPAGLPSGRLDISWMPIGVGQEVVVTTKSLDNLVAGDFVNIYKDGADLSCRKADATTNAKPAHGFVDAIVTAPAAATIFLLGVSNTNQAGLTIGERYFLDKTVAGGVTATPPAANGNIVQELGVATSTTNLVTFNNQNYVEITA